MPDGVQEHPETLIHETRDVAHDVPRELRADRPFKERSFGISSLIFVHSGPHCSHLALLSCSTIIIINFKRSWDDNFPRQCFRAMTAS